MNNQKAYERVGYFLYGRLTEYGEMLMTQLKADIDEAEENGEMGKTITTSIHKSTEEDENEFNKLYEFISKMKRKYPELNPLDVENAIMFS